MENDLKSDEAAPDAPVTAVDTIYGMKVCPSKRAHETVPNEEESSNPETKRMRSGSITPLTACVSSKGTMMSCEIVEFCWKVESTTNR